MITRNRPLKRPPSRHAPISARPGLLRRSGRSGCEGRTVAPYPRRSDPDSEVGPDRPPSPGYGRAGRAGRSPLQPSLKSVLQRVERGELGAEEAVGLLSAYTDKDLGFACIDTGRLHRRGLPEVIFCPGKTSDQVVKIVRALKEAGQNVFATRASPEQYAAVRKAFPKAVYHELPRAITLDVLPPEEPVGMVAVVCAGTSDIPVAEEAALTAERMRARVIRVYDVGVAGLHRLLRHVDTLRSARALVVAAGMEGALPSVVGGLVDRPIIAVPVSTGYGTSMKGVAALLAMLNTCVPGISVVNIDNGFGAGVAAAMVNRLGETQEQRAVAAPRRAAKRRATTR